MTADEAKKLSEQNDTFHQILNGIRIEALRGNRENQLWYYNDYGEPVILYEVNDTIVRKFVKLGYIVEPTDIPYSTGFFRKSTKRVYTIKW